MDSPQHSSLTARALVLAAALGLAAASSAAASEWQVVPSPPAFAAEVTLSDPPFRQVRLPAAALQDRWVRVTGRVLGPPGDARMTIVASTNSRRVSFSTPTTCRGRAPERACETLAWIPAGADEVKVTVWSAEIPRTFAALRIEHGVGARVDAAAAARLDEVLVQMADLYYRSAEVDWPALRRMFEPALAAPSGIDPVPGVVAAVMTRLPGGRHNVLNLNSPSQRAAGAEPDGPMPNCHAVTAGVHLLELPGNWHLAPGRESHYVEAAHQCLFAQPPQTRWIVDLRACGGGSSDLALAALSPLLHAGELLQWESGTGRRMPIELEATGVKTGGRFNLERSLPVGRRLSAPVMVWIGPGTASACEVLAAALSLRPRSTLIGQATAGLATGNESLPIPPEHVMAVTAGRLVVDGRLLEDDRLAPRLELPSASEAEVAALFDPP